MTKYRRLTRVQRYQIVALLNSGQSLRRIAKVLKRSPSTISREVRRNRAEIAQATYVYEASGANLRAQSRASERRPKRYVLVGELEGLIRKRIQMHWSPQQIVGRLAITHPLSRVSHQTIYRYIYRDFLKGGTLYQCLRTGRKRRIKRSTYKSVNTAWKHRHLLRDRPAIVSKRTRLGDFERDCMHGAGIDQSVAVLLTIVDRTSRLTKIAYLKKKTALASHKATVRLLNTDRVRTITNDNGYEFTANTLTEKVLKTRIYFSYPARCWERATIENTNGLIRQYFPRGSDFKNIKPAEIRAAQHFLNHRPRKCLGYKLPIEVHEKLGRGVLRY